MIRKLIFKDIVIDVYNWFKNSFFYKLKSNIIDLFHIAYNKLTRLKIYDSPDVMPLSNFVKYLQTNDARYFTKQFKHSPKLKKAIENFYKEYEAITADRKVIDRIEKMDEIIKLTIKYDTVNLLVNTGLNFSKFMPIEQFKTIVELIEKWNYRIDINKDIFEQLNKLKNKIEGIKSKIQLLESEIITDDKQESININKSLIDISRVLELKYSLKSDELTVSEFVEYQKQAKQEIEERRANNGND